MQLVTVKKMGKSIFQVFFSNVCMPVTQEEVLDILMPF